MRPASLEGDWNRLYAEFPEVYEAWARIEHEPRPIDVIAQRIPLDGARVVDVGAGTGASTFELAEHAARVVGVEPSDAMRAVAERRAEQIGLRGVSVVPGFAEDLPIADGSTDVVAALTTSFWPPERVVSAFVAEAMRVLRPGGRVFVLGTHPDWYGGDLRDYVGGAPEYETAVDRLLAEAGFAAFDFETVQDYGTVERAIETYGFIFGSRAIARLREQRQTRVRWVWRLRYRRR